ncbi:hypothetical protein L7F22_055983 [Adiantum nelumboides]|nr:hypothetical protein [Adiantum nelumboides]
MSPPASPQQGPPPHSWLAQLLQVCLADPTTSLHLPPYLRTALLGPLNNESLEFNEPLYMQLGASLLVCTKTSAPSWSIFQLVSTMKESMDSVTFRLYVQEPFFSQLKDGSKVIEGRCAAGTYNSILPGDVLLFNDKLIAVVKEPLLNGQDSNEQVVRQTIQFPTSNAGCFGGGSIFQAMIRPSPGSHGYMPDNAYGAMQSGTSNPMYGNIGVQPGFQCAAGSYGMHGANLGMAVFSQPYAQNMNLIGRTRGNFGSRIALLNAPVYDNLMPKGKPKDYKEGGQVVKFDTFHGTHDKLKALLFLQQFDAAFAGGNFTESSKLHKKVNHFCSFYEMLEVEGMDRVLPGVTSIEEGVAIYRSFYSKEKEFSRGVLAIYVKRIDEERQPLTLVENMLRYVLIRM